MIKNSHYLTLFLQRFVPQYQTFLDSMKMFDVNDKRKPAFKQRKTESAINYEVTLGNNGLYTATRYLKRVQGTMSKLVEKERALEDLLRRTNNETKKELRDSWKAVFPELDDLVRKIRNKRDKARHNIRHKNLNESEVTKLEREISSLDSNIANLRQDLHISAPEPYFIQLNNFKRTPYLAKDGIPIPQYDVFLAGLEFSLGNNGNQKVFVAFNYTSTSEDVSYRLVNSIEIYFQPYVFVVPTNNVNTSGKHITYVHPVMLPGECFNFSDNGNGDISIEESRRRSDIRDKLKTSSRIEIDLNENVGEGNFFYSGAQKGSVPLLFEAISVKEMIFGVDYHTGKTVGKRKQSVDGFKINSPVKFRGDFLSRDATSHFLEMVRPGQDFKRPVIRTYEITR
ncbi:hypothetical protein HOC35_00510 [Candidatus Woesearchaeota archaeon]|jgi:hypothetical protein|nr:hypothetical protein [Candidatus Woesearchaeota archaeon]